jgi:hypothetical protein
MENDTMSEQPQGRELDAALARALGTNVEIIGDGSYVKITTKHSIFTMPNRGVIPHYSTDLNAMHEVEAEIERRGVMHLYISTMVDVMDYAADAVCDYIHATAEQRARAALAVLSEMGG